MTQSYSHSVPRLQVLTMTTTGGQRLVPFEDWRQQNGYSTVADDRSDMSGRNFLNYSIPRAAMSPSARREPQNHRGTGQNDSCTQTSFFDVVGVTDNKTARTITHLNSPKYLPPADYPTDDMLHGREKSSKKARMFDERASGLRPVPEKLLRTPIPHDQLPRSPFEETALQTTRDRRLPRVHDHHLPRAAPPGLPRTAINNY